MATFLTKFIKYYFNVNYFHSLKLYNKYIIFYSYQQTVKRANDANELIATRKDCRDLFVSLSSNTTTLFGNTRLRFANK